MRTGLGRLAKPRCYDGIAAALDHLKQARSVSKRIGQYIAGKCVRPSEGASGEYGSHAPKTMMVNVVISDGQLARLWKKGTLFVRMIHQQPEARSPTSICPK